MEPTIRGYIIKTTGIPHNNATLDDDKSEQSSF